MTTAPQTTPLPKFVDTKSDVYEFKSSWKSTRFVNNHIFVHSCYRKHDASFPNFFNI